MITDFNSVHDGIQDKDFKEIFGIISSKPRRKGRSDSFTPGDVRDIQDIMYRKVTANMAEQGEFLTLDQIRNQSQEALKRISKEGNPGSSIKDSFFNPITGIGTMLDPGYYNTSDIPISLSPDEATSIYSNGGLGKKIIDEKTKGIFVNGYQFQGQDWTEKETNQIKEYCDRIGFEKTIIELGKNGKIYGGGLLVPAFKKDDGMTYTMDLRSLIRRRIIEKDCLSHFWVADRWNAVLVPKYNISAQDYLMPESFFIPITGLEVNTQRMTVFRPDILPYWGVIRQMGWGQSDFTGYIRSIYAYETAIAGIPIMAQQLSLMYHHIPLDGLIAENGPDYAKRFAQFNSEQMRTMSNVNPRTLNVLGEIKVIERHFTDFDKLIYLVRQDLGAKSGIPESVIFDTLSTGFSENEKATTVGKANSIKMHARDMEYQIKPTLRILVYSCFGPDSPQAKKADSLNVVFESPTILTNEEKAQALTSFSSAVVAFTGAGVMVDTAIKLAKSFIDVEIPDELLEEIESQPIGERENLVAGNEMDKMRSIKDDSSFKEEDHPRKTNGEFGSGGSSGSKENKSSSLKKITNRSELPEHIKKMKIPPAWTDLHVSDNPDSDLQVTGKDSKGRTQYVYSEKFSSEQSKAKFARINALNENMKIVEDQNKDNMKKGKEEAHVLNLIMKTGIRPGGEGNTKAEKQAYGATTLEGRHVIEEDGNVYLRFVGKKGVDLNIPVDDKELAKYLLSRKDKSGEDGKLFSVNSVKLSRYTNSLDGGGFKTKDMRTHLGTSTAMSEVSKSDPPKTKEEYKKMVMEVAKKVSKKLGNTPLIALQSYINPAVFEVWKEAI